MDNTGAAAARPEEIAEAHRRCWAFVGGVSENHRCKRTARLEVFGWRYCIRHYWQRYIAGSDDWKMMFEKLRWTEIARHRKRGA